MGIFDSFYRRQREKAFLRNIMTAPPCPNCHSGNTMKHSQALIVYKETRKKKRWTPDYFCNNCSKYFITTQLEEDELVHTNKGSSHTLWW